MGGTQASRNLAWTLHDGELAAKFLLRDRDAGRVEGQPAKWTRRLPNSMQKRTESLVVSQTVSTVKKSVAKWVLVGVLANELAPGALAALGSWELTVAAADLAVGEVRADKAESDQFALDAAVAPAWFSRARRSISWWSSFGTGRRRRGRWRYQNPHLPRTGSRVPAERPWRRLSAPVGHPGQRGLAPIAIPSPRLVSGEHT